MLLPSLNPLLLFHWKSLVHPMCLSLSLGILDGVSADLVKISLYPSYKLLGWDFLVLINWALQRKHLHEAHTVSALLPKGQTLCACEQMPFSGQWCLGASSWLEGSHCWCCQQQGVRRWAPPLYLYLSHRLNKDKIREKQCLQTVNLKTISIKLELEQSK